MLHQTLSILQYKLAPHSDFNVIPIFMIFHVHGKQHLLQKADSISYLDSQHVPTYYTGYISMMQLFASFLALKE